MICALFITNRLEKNIARNEVIHLGTGMQLLHNIEINNAEKRFAIMHPPLPGLILALPLYFECFYLEENFINMNAIDKYDDMVSYLYAKNLPYLAGKNIIDQISKEDFQEIIFQVRSVCTCIILFLLAILITYVTKSVWISIGIIIFFSNLDISHYIFLGIANNLLMIFLLLSLLIINLMLHNPNYFKSIVLGILMGGVYATAKSSGMLIFTLLLLGCIISHDILQEKVSKGFNKRWIGYISCSASIFLLTVWICYGAYLTSPDAVITSTIFQITSLICEELKCNISNIRIIPFDDILRQFIFSIIFDDKAATQTLCHVFEQRFNCQCIFGKYAAITNIVPLFTQYMLLFCIMFLFIYRKFKKSKVHQIFFRDDITKHFILSLFILLPLCFLSIFLYMDNFPEKIEHFVTNALTLSILLSLVLLGIFLEILMTIFNITRKKIFK